MSNLPFIPTSEIHQAVSDDGDYSSPLDLQRELISRPASTFLLISSSNRDGVSEGDILVVDRSLVPRTGQKVIAVNEGSLKLMKHPVEELWGVVTYVIHKTC